MRTSEPDRTLVDDTEFPGTAVDLMDSTVYIESVPYEYFAELRRTRPVSWQEPATGPGYWAVTTHPECVAVNRDWERFSSFTRGAVPFEIPDAELAVQQQMMLNMDPPLHTRYRRLVNKGFTPKMVSRLEERIHAAADGILDRVCEKGEADFVTEVAADLPLVVIAELLGVPYEDRHKMFDWSNTMLAGEDPEFQPAEGMVEQAAMDLYAYADELFAQKAANPHEDLMSVLAGVEMEGERLSELELDLFFLMLTVAGNETTRNLVSGAMQAFFDHPDQWARLLADRSLLPPAVEEMLRYVSPVMNFRRTATTDIELRGTKIHAGDKVVIYYVSGNRDEEVFDHPDAFDLSRDPNPHIAFGGGGPHFCLGANLARMEIRVMYEHLLDRLPDVHPTGPPDRLQSQFINGVKHLPVAFSPSAPRSGSMAGATRP